uniref:Oxysterol-binding protein n=1 Tax=Syphacia muris TaxID=451379 RepID=A0A0N5AWQ5_9BILA
MSVSISYCFIANKLEGQAFCRNNSEVGQTCRGSINLQEARIHTDTTTNSLTISASSQTFHLKAQNECDRQNWLKALEYARHCAIKAAESEEDEELKMDSLSNCGSPAAIDSMNQALEGKLDEVRKCNSLIAKHSDELVKALNEIEALDNKRSLNERIRLFKITAEAMAKACDDFVKLTAKESRKVSRYASNEHEQRLRLQDQIEVLAKQHSSLERVAFMTATDSNSGVEPPYYDSDEEFHDASDKMLDERSDDRKSNSSHTNSVTEEDRQLFEAQIITPLGNCEQVKFSGSDSAIAKPTQSNIRVRRTSIPERLTVSLNLWSIMRNCIGKELSKIPMPVNFNEPLSVLQRISEDLEYAHLLDSAATITDSCEQMCYIAAYAVSSYSTTGNRVTKPFNPLLGETFECDRREDLGWRSLAEQVSHHPPITAHHAEGKLWKVHQDFTMTSRFRGKYLSVIPVGYTHVEFLNQANKYSFKKVTTTVHNIIVGKLWIDNHGEMVIDNHVTGDKCFLKFHAYSYFSREQPRKVTGLVRDRNGKLQWVIQGFWDKYLDYMKVKKGDELGDKSILETDVPKRVWTVNPPYPNAEKMYHFTKFAIELNEIEEGVAPTDSRLRPDQRLMEEGKWDDANRVKVELEEKQRSVRRKREALAEEAMQAGQPFEEYKPLWFTKAQHECTGAVIHLFTGEYWQKKEAGDWSMCPDIF